MRDLKHPDSVFGSQPAKYASHLYTVGGHFAKNTKPLRGLGGDFLFTIGITCASFRRFYLIYEDLERRWSISQA
jgi:hypothetical protein